MDKTQVNEVKTFEEIKHIDENGNEYWLARELQMALEYSGVGLNLLLIVLKFLVEIVILKLVIILPTLAK